MSAPARAWVLGGSGAVGGALVRELRSRGLDTTLTFHRGRARALELEGATGAKTLELDLAEPGALRSALSARLAAGDAPDVLFHCAAIADSVPFAELTDARLEQMQRIGVGALVAAVQTLAPRWIERGRGSAVMVGALVGGQSLPLPVGLAAANGAAIAAVMALAKELGPHGVRVNAAVLGPLESGLGGELSAKTRSDYLAFSALKRLGTVEETARAIAWLGLDDRAMNGKSLAIQGGI
jgi:3-oxoacyl-[acyl-carrier protein] reductase